MNKIKQMGQKGFTVVELLIVIVIIGILAALVFVQFNGMQQRGRDAERKADIRLIESKLAEYYADEGGYPIATTATAVATAFSSADPAVDGIPADALEDPREGDTGFGYTYLSADGESYTITASMEAEDNYSRTN